MIAIINGIKVQGSPEEILEFQNLQERKMLDKLPKPYPNTSGDAWWHFMPKTSSGSTVKTDKWDGIWSN